MPDALRVLVTAGAGGIGRAIADAFIGRGDRVYVCDVAQAALDDFHRQHPTHGAVMADVSDPRAVDDLFDALEDDLGGLDVLVNNAGIAGPTGAVEDMAVEDWDRTVAININGQFYCARRAMPHLKKAAGALINISSVAGRLGYPLRTPYAASKWAVVGFTKSLAAEVGPDGVRVNAILPGIVAGERIRRVIQAKADAREVSYDDMETDYLSTVSLRRMVSSADVANMALFLCSDAGANISGQALSVCANVETLK